MHVMSGKMLAWLTFAVVVLGANAVCADDGPVQGDEQETAVFEGIWPTRQMVDSFLRRWTDDLAQQYDLRPDQQGKLQSQMLERWPKFLEDNRRELQPLLNEYFEARMGMTPPTADHVASWATRALPLFGKLKDNIDETHAELRPILNAQQQAKLEVRCLGVNAGLKLVEGKLKRWSAGDFKEGEWWDPPRSVRRQRRSSRAGDAAETTSQPANSPSAWPARLVEEMDAWTRYVAEFSNEFQLDQSQRNAARSILRELLDRAGDYIRTNLPRILVLEQKIENPVGTEDEGVIKELGEVYGPIDDMFRELDERLNKLTTPGQRRRVELDRARRADQPNDANPE